MHIWDVKKMLKQRDITALITGASVHMKKIIVNL